MKAYSYVRFSTDSQTWGDSERRQEQLAKDYCQRRGLTLATDSFKDRGVSGWKGKNRQDGGAFAGLLKVAKSGDRILIEDNDRFSREAPLTALMALWEVVQKGIVVAFLKTGVEVTDKNFNDAAVLFPNFFQAYLGNQENEKKSFRAGEVWIQKRSKLGDEKMTAKCVGWLRLSNDRKQFEKIPERAAVVKRIFELSRSGVGANSIAKRLNMDLVKPFGRAPIWHPSYVKKILDNRAVIGEFTPGTGRGGSARKLLEPVPGYYPAVISKELFATVQQMRKVRPSFKGRSSFNVFSKLAFDRATGSSMAYVNKSRSSGKRWHYLVANAALLGKADYAAWPYDHFRAAFLEVCEEAALAKSPEAKDTGELAVAQMELAETETQIGRLVDFLARGQSGSVETKLVALEASKAALQKRIWKARPRRSTPMLPRWTGATPQHSGRICARPSSGSRWMQKPGRSKPSSSMAGATASPLRATKPPSRNRFRASHITPGQPPRPNLLFGALVRVLALL